MRQRDALLYHLKRLGFERSEVRPTSELWAHRDDPRWFLTIPARHDVPRAVVEAILKAARLSAEEILRDMDSEESRTPDPSPPSPTVQ